MSAESIVVYRGEQAGNRSGRYWTTDPEWAREFTQSGQDHEIKQAEIAGNLVYRHKPLPEAAGTDGGRFWDQVAAEARRKGFDAFWVDEGVGQPNSIYVLQPSVVKNISRFLPVSRENPDDTTSWSMDIVSSLLREFSPSVVDFALMVKPESYGRRIMDLDYLKANERGQGAGTRFMEALVALADRHHVLLTLQPSTSFGASSRTRLERFYRRFGFVRNRGSKADHSLSMYAAMYRKPRST